MLTLENLGFAYETRTGSFPVFQGINLEIRENEFFSVIGPSGCGKSTLLNVIAGFESPTEGSVKLGGQSISGISHERAMVFQQDAVFPWLTVSENIAYGLKVRGVPAEKRAARVAQLIAAVGLEEFARHYPRELSGGMRKRVDLARALANDPRMLLMDEPFGALDAMTKEKLQAELIQIWESSKKTVVFITHDIEEALFLSDRVALMQPLRFGGAIKVFDVPFQRPRNLFLKEETGFQHMRRELIQEFRRIEV